MTVVQGWAGGKRFKVSGEGYSPVGQFSLNEQSFDPLQDLGASLLLHGAVLCNDAKLEESGVDGGGKTWRMIGDPTEGALVVAAAKGGLWRKKLEEMIPRVSEIPFDSDRKRMTTIHKPKKRMPKRN
jgi:Ca2+-transporting ATPase